MFDIIYNRSNLFITSFKRQKVFSIFFLKKSSDKCILVKFVKKIKLNKEMQLKQKDGCLVNEWSVVEFCGICRKGTANFLRLGALEEEEI